MGIRFQLKFRRLWRIGKISALAIPLACASCTSSSLSGHAEKGEIPLAKKAEPKKSADQDAFDSQAEGFALEATPNSGATGDAMQAADLTSYTSTIIALVDHLPADDEIPVFRSISVFRRPEGFPVVEEEDFNIVSPSPDGDRIEGNGSGADELNAPSEPSEPDSPSTADRIVPDAVVTAISPAGASGEDGVHVVKEGESLWQISKIYGTTVAELKRLNDLTSNRIDPGDRLKLPERQE